MKDWTGNKKSVFATLGASNHSKQERETMDYYATEPKAIDLLASKFDIPHRVWECACGGGSLSQRLKERGHEVISTDIIDRGYEGFNGECDFLSRLFHPTIEGDYAIVTNPPYKFVTEFVLTALDVLPDGCYLCLFLKTTALESRGRWEKIYKATPPRYVFQCIDRILCAKNAEFEDARKNLGAGAQAYAWFVWQKGYKGHTTLDWI
jgi:hypothetical protein